MAQQLDPTLFTDAAIPEETRAFNARIVAAIESGPELWDLDRDTVRAARRAGKGIFPLEPFDEKAETIEIEGKVGPVPLRIIRPDAGMENGAFLHIHGGGWVYGNADMQDQRLKELANATGLACISVEYRLAPENPYPAPADDCEAAALWLAKDAGKSVNTSFLAIGGESAGGHLSVCSLLRLRDNHNMTPFHAAVLIAGIYDIGMTPSAANYSENLILRHKDMVNFSACLLQNNEDRRSPEISPLYAKLDGMPPAHFTVGTADALLDDSLFMAQAWLRSQGDVELDVYPGGCHVFQYFDELKQARDSKNAIHRFLNRQIDGAKTS
ncbi:MAG: alpha/beta hydrolase [Pseudomonadota bacterium]